MKDNIYYALFCLTLTGIGCGVTFFIAYSNPLVDTRYSIIGYVFSIVLGLMFFKILYTPFGEPTLGTGAQ